MLTIINQIWEINEKSTINAYAAIERNLNRINNELESMGYTIINPMGRPYKDTDIEANIANALHSKSKIVKVLKPIVYQK